MDQFDPITVSSVDFEHLSILSDENRKRRKIYGFCTRQFVRRVPIVICNVTEKFNIVCNNFHFQTILSFQDIKSMYLYRARAFIVLLNLSE